MPAEGLEIVTRGSGVEFAVKVVPGASRTKVAGILGAALKIALAAPPEAGKANAALVELLAEMLDVKRADVTLISGHSRPLKRIAVTGVTAEHVRARLATPG